MTTGAVTGGATGITGAAGFSTAGAAAAGFAGGGGKGGVGFATGGATAGLAAIGGRATGGRAGAGCGAAPSFCWVMARSTSPGREMCDRSILVLISSSPRSGRLDLAACAGPSDKLRKWARTFSASCSSSELECVFFSVTPTSVSTSRMALLLTSSSRARSLIRTLLIRPFLYPALCLSLHRSLTESAFCTRTSENTPARAMTIRLFWERSRHPARARRLFPQQRILSLLQQPPVHPRRQPGSPPRRLPARLLPRHSRLPPQPRPR